MSYSSESWIHGLQFSSLLWHPPQDDQQREAQIMAYVDYFGQFISEQFPDEISQLVHSNYPSTERRLLDDVLAKFVLHHPENGHAIIHPILSCIIDGSLIYDKNDPPFCSFISLVNQINAQEISEQWALACGEILRVLTHYNRPIYKFNHHTDNLETDRKPLRPLTPWITDILLAAPLGIRSDYFRWCGGVMGKYAAGEELKPPTTSRLQHCSKVAGKHPQLMPSTPRWAVANGAGVILSVCDEEVVRYETACLTAAAVPALLLPPPTTHLDEHLIAGLPALEPYARLFHRYYSIATPSATQRLLLGLLEAPPSWAPDALDAAVQLVELLRAAEEYASGIKLSRNWMHLHFLRAIGTAMSMRAGIAADAAAALLFRILSQPALLFPPLRHAEGAEIEHEPLDGSTSSYKKKLEEVTTDATAQGIASMLCAHGPEVEWRICTIWEAAYGLIPLSSSAVDLPEIIVATPLQPPALSWGLYSPLIRVLEYLPRGSPSEACFMRIFVATVEAILSRTFPSNSSSYQTWKLIPQGGSRSSTKKLAVAELRTMIHSLFLESCASMDVASRLLFVVLTVCVSYEAFPNGSKKPTGTNGYASDEIVDEHQTSGKADRRNKANKKQGPVATFDSYVLAAVCALACELQMLHLTSRNGFHTNPKHSRKVFNSGKTNGVAEELENGISSAVRHSRRILGILEALFSLKPSSVGTSWSCSSNEIVAAAMVAAHVSEIFGRSKACTNALSVLMQCKWDPEISTRAFSLYHLIDIHGKTVASIVGKAEPLESHFMGGPAWKGDAVSFKPKQTSSSKSKKSSTSQTKDLSSEFANCNKAVLLNPVLPNNSEKSISNFPVDASNWANFFTKEWDMGFNCCAQALLRSVFSEKQELCFSVVSLLWHKLIAAPEMQLRAASTSAQQGWRQVADALCNVVSASPAIASTAIVLQAERDLQPWIARDDEQGQKIWIINQRIVKLIAEIMRNHDNPEALMVLASASELLLRATDGMLVGGEACTLPQLELLEVTARVFPLVIDWDETGTVVADGLSNLLKCRLSCTIRCLSHPSTHVRTLGTSVIRNIMHYCSMKPDSYGDFGRNSTSCQQPYQCHDLGVVGWLADIEKCMRWEAHSRRTAGLTLVFLNAAANELGCPLS